MRVLTMGRGPRAGLVTAGVTIIMVRRWLINKEKRSLYWGE